MHYNTEIHYVVPVKQDTVKQLTAKQQIIDLAKNASEKMVQYDDDIMIMYYTGILCGYNDCLNIINKAQE